MARAARAGLDGDVLVLVDRRGGELGRFDRAECQPDATAWVREQTATLPQCDEDSASNGPDGGYGDPSDPPVVDAQTAAVQRDRFAALVGGDYGEVRAAYDDRGVPVVALVDHHRNAIDDEMDYEVSDVVVR
jgi:hypothetical protein